LNKVYLTLISGIALLCANASAKPKSWLREVSRCLFSVGVHAPDAFNPFEVWKANFGEGTTDIQLHRNVRYFGTTQEVIAGLSASRFNHGVKLRVLLEGSRNALKGDLTEAPSSHPIFNQTFGLKRKKPNLLALNGLLYPEQQISRSEIATEKLRNVLRVRLSHLEGFEAPETVERFMAGTLDLFGGYYHCENGRVILGTLVSFTIASGTSDDFFYTSNSESESDQILEDVENRLESARYLIEPEKRREAVLIALYGYYQALPYISGSHTIGWPVFVGIAHALLNEFMTPVSGRKELMEIASHSQSYFVATLQNHFAKP